MFKSYIKTIAIAFSSSATVLAACQGASAQLDVGHYGIQPGLEPEYLQYQLSGQDLNQMRAIPACTIGFGLGCDKTGTVLEQLLESNGGPNYQELLMRAAGGAENFHNFASFYGDNSHLPLVPYASFWQNDTPHIMDGYQYLLGSPVTQTPVPGLELVTKNFYWAPEAVGNSQNLRSGLLNLKYSFGRLLFEEVAKIPNVQQQIQSLDLPLNIKQFYLGNFSQGLRALNTGDEASLKHSILDVLSLPFSPNGGEFGRPNIGIPKEFNEHMTENLLNGDVFVETPPVLPEGDVVNLDIPSYPEGDVFVQEGSKKGFPIWLIAGGGLAALLLLISLGGGSSSGQVSHPIAAVTQPMGHPPSPTESPPTPPGGTVPSNHNQVTEIPPTTVIIQTHEEQLKKVSEPSIVKSLLLLIILLCIVSHKQRAIRIKSTQNKRLA